MLIQSQRRKGNSFSLIGLSPRTSTKCSKTRLRAEQEKASLRRENLEEEEWPPFLWEINMRNVGNLEMNKALVQLLFCIKQNITAEPAQSGPILFLRRY